MSRWPVTLAFDGEVPGEHCEWREPWKYAQNREPDEDGRGGHLMLAETHRDADHEELMAFLRLSVEGRGYETRLKAEGVVYGVDVVLDEAHVRELHRCLGEWIGRLGKERP